MAPIRRVVRRPTGASAACNRRLAGAAGSGSLRPSVRDTVASLATQVPILPHGCRGLFR